MPELVPPNPVQLATRWLESNAETISDTVIRWCQQNSWSNNVPGLLKMAGMLQHDFEPLGLANLRFMLPPWESINDLGESIHHATGPALIWHHRPEAARRVLLLIHYDTVYPPSDAADVRTSDRRLIGPGVADAKGGIAVILFAMQAILRFGLADNLGISILLNPDEEVGSQSSSALLAELTPQFDFALVFEPSLPDGAMVANRKGTGNFTAVIHGRAAHAGRNLAAGRNAIVHAARLATELDSWNQSAVNISANVGKISGGGSLNQVPDLATLSINVRVTSLAVMEQVKAQLQELAHRYSTSDGYTCHFHGQFHSPPKNVDDDERMDKLRQRVTRAAAEAGCQLSWRDTGGACDGNKLWALGLPNVDTMGPTGGDLHSPTEYCEISSLVTAAETLVHLIAEF